MVKNTDRSLKNTKNLCQNDLFNMRWLKRDYLFLNHILFGLRESKPDAQCQENSFSNPMFVYFTETTNYELFNHV